MLLVLFLGGNNYKTRSLAVQSTKSHLDGLDIGLHPVKSERTHSANRGVRSCHLASFPNHQTKVFVWDFSKFPTHSTEMRARMWLRELYSPSHLCELPFRWTGCCPLPEHAYNPPTRLVEMTWPFAFPSHPPSAVNHWRPGRNFQGGWSEIFKYCILIILTNFSAGSQYRVMNGSKMRWRESRENMAEKYETRPATTESVGKTGRRR